MNKTMTKGNTLTHKELPQINSKINIPTENSKNNSQRKNNSQNINFHW